MSLELDIHALRSEGFSFSQIGERLGLTKDQAQKRYQKFLLSSPLPHTPTPEGDRLFSGGPVKRVTPPTPPFLSLSIPLFPSSSPFHSRTQAHVRRAAAAMGATVGRSNARGERTATARCDAYMVPGCSGARARSVTGP